MCTVLRTMHRASGTWSGMKFPSVTGQMEQGFESLLDVGGLWVCPRAPPGDRVSQGLGLGAEAIPGGCVPVPRCVCAFMGMTISCGCRELRPLSASHARLGSNLAPRSWEAVRNIEREIAAIRAGS